MQLLNNNSSFFKIFLEILKEVFGLFGKQYNECKNTGFSVDINLSIGEANENYTIKQMIILVCKEAYMRYHINLYMHQVYKNQYNLLYVIVAHF